MSIRQMFPGSIVKPGFNPLAVQTPTILYNLYGWGSNANGQLGLGNTTNYSSPVQLGSDTGWTDAAGGYTHWLGIRSGNLYACGQNSSLGAGKLGTGNTTDRSSPVQVGSLSTWAKVTAMQQSSVALIS